MILSQAADGFLLSLRAGGYSRATVDLYRYVMDCLVAYLADPPLNQIKPNDLKKYFVYLQDEYKPRRKAPSGKALSGSTLQNHWKAIRSLYNWATEEELIKSRPDEKLKLPENNPRAVLPLTEAEVKALLKAAEYTREAKPGNRSSFSMHRATAARDTALILLLLDTGVRAGEAGRLLVEDVDLKTGEVTVHPYGNSKRKTKARSVFLGKSGQKAVWRYLATRPDAQKDDPLFLSITGRPMDANSIRCLLVDLGEKAGISHVHPHRLRHTFSIQYLKNGGDVFTLQRLLGHASLDMVKHYLEIAAVDAQNAHRRASPADNWHL